MSNRLGLMLATGAVVGVASQSFAALTFSTGAIEDSWASIGTPTLQTTDAPNTNSTVSNGGGPTTRVAISFTPTTNFTLDKFALVIAGGPSTGNVNIYALPSFAGGTESSGFVNKSFSTGLLGGGAGLNFTFSGTPDEAFGIFDLTGVDEIALTAGQVYMIDFVPDPNDTAYNFFVRRGGEFYTGGSNIYSRDFGASADDGQRFDVAGGRRDAPLALFAVPEPASLGLLAIGGLAILGRRRCA